MAQLEICLQQAESVREDVSRRSGWLLREQPLTSVQKTAAAKIHQSQLYGYDLHHIHSYLNECRRRRQRGREVTTF